jgi:hypothetical protein
MQKAMLCPVLVKMCKDVKACWISQSAGSYRAAIDAPKILAKNPQNKYCDWIFSMVKMLQTNLATWLKSGLVTLTGLSTMAIVAAPAQANWFQSKPLENGYKRCGTSLDQAGIAKDVAATACAEVLYPEDLGACVVNITPLKLDAMTTLNACRRVRRPLELATCVQDVHKQDGNAVLGNVLEACRQSLLPERYGKCVVGLNQSLAVPTAKGLTTCIDASDRPIDMLSTFVPIGQLPRLNGFGSTDSMGATPVAPNSTPNPTPATGTIPGQLY